MPSKNLNIKYPEEYQGYTEDEKVHAFIDEMDRHLCKVEIPQEDELQIAGLYYVKTGDMVTVYGTCTPTTAILGKLPFKPILHSDTMNMRVPAFKVSNGSLVNMIMTALGVLMTGTAVTEAIMMQFTYMTND